MQPSNLPFVSIIVAYAPGRGYSTVLESIRRIDYPKEKMELLVIAGRLPARQRNAGIREATGEFLFFFDDDVTHNPDIIHRMLRFYGDPNVAIVGGPNLTPPSDSFLQKCFGYVMCSYFATASMSSRYKPVGVARRAGEKELILCNLSGRSEVLKRYPLDERLYPAEENEWFNRIRAAGYDLIYDPEAVSFHSRRPTIRKFIKQNFGYGRGRMEMFFIQPSAFEVVFCIPSLFLLYCVSLPFVAFVPQLPAWWKIAAFIPAAVYCVIDCAASLIAVTQARQVKAAGVLPFLFPLAQLPYGAGMLWALLKRPRGWKKLPEVAITVERKEP